MQNCQILFGFSFYRHVNGSTIPYSSHRRQGFFVGIVNNLKLLPKFYPGWIIRLYTDLDRNDPKLKDICDIACSDENIDICLVDQLPGTPFINATDVYPRNWRFFPTLDPQVYSQK